MIKVPEVKKAHLNRAGVTVLLLFSLMQNNSMAQQVDFDDHKPNLIIDVQNDRWDVAGSEYKLPIIVRAAIATKNNASEFYSTRDQFALIMQESLERFGLNNIAVTVLVIPSERDSLSQAVEPYIMDDEELASFDEVLVVREASLFQETISENDHSPVYFDIARHRARMIRTSIQVIADFYDFAQETNLGSMPLWAEYVDRDAKKSKAEALKKFEKKLMLELERIYGPAADVLSARDGHLVVGMGKNQGVQKNDWVEIVEPDRIISREEDTYLRDGGVVGLASVYHLMDDSCRLRVVRQWSEHQPGSWALQRRGPLFAINICVTPSLFVDYDQYAVQFSGAAERSSDWGGGFHFIRIRDSQSHNDYGIGFSGFTLWRFHNGRRCNWGIKGAFDFDIPFRKDDDNNIVSSVLFSFHFGLVNELVLSRTNDLLFLVGYRHGFKNSQWDYSAGEETFPAYWQGHAPIVNNSGFFISVGYRWLVFL